MNPEGQVYVLLADEEQQHDNLDALAKSVARMTSTSEMVRRGGLCEAVVWTGTTA